MAAADYVDQIQNLYIAYFGRPADPVGLAYWTEQVNAANGNLSMAIAGFSASSESGALYAGVSLSDKVSAIYQNLFNRTPESTGLAFWVAKIASGEVSDAQAAYQILSSAGPGDAAAIANKLSVAKAFTAQIDTPAEIAGYSGLTSAASARSFLANVDSTSYTLNQATTALNTGVAQATGTTVTPVSPAPAPTPAPAAFATVLDTATGVLSFSGTATGDISVNLSAQDVTFSRGGNKADTVALGAGGATSITLASGENLVSVAADLKNITDAAPINGTGTVTLTDTILAAAAVRAIDTAVVPVIDLTAATTLGGSVADVTAVKTANTSTLTLASTLNLSVSDVALNFETGKINATGSSDVLTVTDLASAPLSLANMIGFETVHLAGSSATVTIANGAGTVVDSSAAVDVQLGTGGQTFKGSAGNDTVTTVSGGNTLTGGAGNDTFVFNNTSGTNTITDLATGDVLKVSVGGSVTANNVSSFEATASTITNGTVTINAALGGSTIDVSKATGDSGFTLVGTAGADIFTGSAKADTFTGGAGNNVFKFAASHFSATDTAGLISAADTITDWSAAAFSNKIDFDVTLGVVEHAVPAVAGTALINSEGLATFDASDATLAQKLAAVVSAVNTDAVGTSVVFRDGSDSYLFVVGNADAGIQAGDALIKLSGFSAGAVNITGGDISSLNLLG